MARVATINLYHFQWKPNDEEKLEMSGEGGAGHHDLYEAREHGELGYDREGKGFIPGKAGGDFTVLTVDCAGEGSEREMGYISSEPSLQEFIPHQMDPDNTPPPTGNTSSSSSSSSPCSSSLRLRGPRWIGEYDGGGDVSPGDDVHA